MVILEMHQLEKWPCLSRLEICDFEAAFKHVEKCNFAWFSTKSLLKRLVMKHKILVIEKQKKSIKFYAASWPIVSINRIENQAKLYFLITFLTCLNAASAKSVIWISDVTRISKICIEKLFVWNIRIWIAHMSLSSIWYYFGLVGPL